jgi:hypothetical protein
MDRDDRIVRPHEIRVCGWLRSRSGTRRRLGGLARGKKGSQAGKQKRYEMIATHG